MSELDNLIGRRAVYNNITIFGVAKAILGSHPDCSDWLVQSHSLRTNYQVTVYVAEPDSIMGQLRALADTILCYIVVHEDAQVIVIVDKPQYDIPAILDIPAGRNPHET